MRISPEDRQRFVSFFSEGTISAKFVDSAKSTAVINPTYIFIINISDKLRMGHLFFACSMLCYKFFIVILPLRSRGLYELGMCTDFQESSVKTSSLPKYIRWSILVCHSELWCEFSEKWTSEDSHIVEVKMLKKNQRQYMDSLTQKGPYYLNTSCNNWRPNILCYPH